MRREICLAERAKKAWEMRQQGLSFSEIGEALGYFDDPTRPLSAATARQLVRRWRSRQNRPVGVPPSMTTRAFKILQIEAKRTGKPISTEMARKLIETGELIRIPNCGYLAFGEIKRWAYHKTKAL